MIIFCFSYSWVENENRVLVDLFPSDDAVKKIISITYGI